MINVIYYEKIPLYIASGKHDIPTNVSGYKTIVTYNRPINGYKLTYFLLLV